MFGRFLASLMNERGNDQVITRRRHSRRSCDKCVTQIAGKMYPVVNWSLGGLLIAADDRQFSAGSELDVTMKFKLRNEVLDVPHKARVVRKTREKVAFEFLPLNRQTRNSFQNVVDDYMVTEFANSQVT